MSTTYRIEKVDNQNDLALRASQLISSHIDLVLGLKDRAQIALSGGSTPSATYRLLALEHLPWDRVDVLLGDERWVDPSDEASNAGMLRKTLLNSAPGSACRFYEVPTVGLLNPKESVEAFSKILQKLCVGEPPIFDFILLGLGDDGHTASLFPGSESLSINDRWVTDVNAKGHNRITLTAPVLSAARKVVFLVSGSSKQIALKRLIDPSEPLQRTPARLVQPDSEILVLADEAASALV